MNNSRTLRALIVEDNVLDAELLIEQLRETGYRLEWTRVDSEADYLSALDTKPDIVLSDYNLPGFGGLQALTLLKQRGLDVPFVLVSGTIGESLAVAAMVAGAHDYVLKDNLVRLAPVIERELRACVLRHERRDALAQLARQTGDLTERVKELTCLYAVSGLAQRSGLPLEELFEQTMDLLVRAYQWPKLVGVRIVHGSTIRQTPGFRLTKLRQEAPLVLDGSTVGSITVSYREAPPVPTGSTFLDEERLMLEAVAQRISDGLTDRRLRSALTESERKSRATFNQAAVGIVRVDLDRNILEVNQKFCELTGYQRDELLCMSVIQISHPDDRGQDTALRRQLLAGEIDHFRSEKRYLRKDGLIIWVRRTTSLARDAANEEPEYIIVVEDITDRKTVEENYRTTFDRAPVGIMHSTADRRILKVNSKLCEIFGYTQEELLTMSTLDLLPREFQDTERPQFFDQMLSGEMQEYSSHRPFVRKDGSNVWINRHVSLVRDSAGEPLYFLRVIEDISEQKHAEIALQESERFAKSTIDALSIHLCVLDETGTIIAVNKVWRDFAAANGLAADHLVADGANYLTACANATGDGAEQGQKFAAGIHAVLRGEMDIFTLEYPCHSPTEQRWFLGKVSPFHGTGPRRVVVTHEDITERKLTQLQIRRLNQLYSTLSQTNATIVRIKDRNELFKRICQIAVTHNQFALAWIGLVEPQSSLVRLVASAGDASAYLEGLRISVDAGIPEGRGTSGHAIREGRTVVCNDIANDATLSHWHGRTRTAGLQAVASLPLRTAGKVIGVLTFMAGETGFFDSALVTLLEEMAEDISFALDGIDLGAKHQQAQLALQDSDEKFRELTRNIPQAFWMTDAEQKDTIYISPAYEKITGRSISELVTEPQSWLQAIHEEDRERVKFSRKERAPLGTYDIEYRMLRTDGSLRWVHDRAFPVRNIQGEVYRIAGIAEDITERKQVQERLANLAHYDSLTGLPNRVLFNDRLRQAVARGHRNQWIVGVLFLDLDRFKIVNDTLGHVMGDQLLNQVGTRLSACLRPTDTVGRLSGDEFAVILSELAVPQDAGYVAQKIIDTLATPFDLEGNEVFVTASIGIAVYPSDGQDVEMLVRDADAAMYGAKAAGRNNFLYYTAAMNARATEKLQMETGIRRALERSELLLHYQPKIDIASGRISGLEALLRWQSPERGLILPGQFIPVLEETGLIVQVGEWVLHAACAQLRAWREAGVSLVPVAINLSARQLRQQGFAAILERALKTHGVDPQLIQMEITESALMEKPEEAITILNELKALGIRLEADDFGTGYSSLSYLKRFPLDALKIDRSFVRDMTTDEDDAVIAQTVITLAHSLGLKVIAEGVETEEQLVFLGDNHCDEAQGFLFAKPLHAEECMALLSSNRPLHRPFREPEADGLRPAILVVDDSEDDLTLAQIMLQKDGYKILTASDTRQAFELLNSKRISIVISDQCMPQMSGVDFLRQVKLMYPQAVRIMFSGASDFSTATAAINEGEVQKFFVKGRDEEKLRREIKRRMGCAERNAGI